MVAGLSLPPLLRQQILLLRQPSFLHSVPKTSAASILTLAGHLSLTALPEPNIVRAPPPRRAQVTAEPGDGKHHQLRYLQGLEPQRCQQLEFRGACHIWFATPFCSALGKYFGSHYPCVGTTVNKYISHGSSSRTDDALGSFGRLEQAVMRFHG